MKSDLKMIQEMWRHPLTGKVNKQARKRVLHKFPELSSCEQNSYLALSKYLDGTPERFYSREALRVYTKMLEKMYTGDPTQFLKILDERSNDIGSAMLTLNEIRQQDWHDTVIERDGYAFMRLCDRSLHPAYLRLAEGVFQKLIRPIATCLRLERNKSTDDLWKLSACVKEMEPTDCSSLVAHCNSDVRNSIAHGHVTYRLNEVVYFGQDGKSQTLSNIAVYEMIDGLVDTCHGCSLALKLFYLQHLGNRIPQQIMLEELQAETETPWWHIEGCLVSELSQHSQLILYARPMSRDYHKVLYMCIYSVILAEHFAPGFDRYMVSLCSPIASIGWAVFDGKKLRGVWENGVPRSMDDYKDSGHVYYKPNMSLPKFLCRLETILMSFRLHMPLAFNEIRKNLGQVFIIGRQAKIHRSGWGAAVNGIVVVDITDEDDPKQAVKMARRRIIRAAKRLASKNIKWCNLTKYLPIGYARIAVFQTDRRHRQLSGLSPDLICIIQKQFITRIKKPPDIDGSKIEIVWPYRFVWNNAWLESLPT